MEDLFFAPREPANIEGLDDVFIRGMLLSEKLKNDGFSRERRKPLPGESDEDAATRAGAEVIPRVLHYCVVAADGSRFKTAEQWDAFGILHAQDAYRLFNTAMRLSGQDVGDVEKN